MDEREAFQIQQEARRHYAASREESQEAAVRRYLTGFFYRQTHQPPPKDGPERPTGTPADTQEPAAGPADAGGAPGR